MPSEWMTTGRHPVDLGPSFVRALKSRAGEVAKPAKTKLPVNDFFSFRYKFKPESIDDVKPGVVEAKASDNLFRVERPSTQHGDSHTFTATEQSARDWECVLILDEETGAYTLEKLDSLFDLSYDGRSGSRTSRVSSPQPSSHADLDLEEDAEGEVDMESMHLVETVQRLEEEEEEIVPPPQPAVKPTKANGVASAGTAPTKGKVKNKGKASNRSGKANRGKKSKEVVEDTDLEELLVEEPPPRPNPRKRGGASTSKQQQQPPQKATPSTTPSRPLALPTKAPPRPSDILVPPSSVTQPPFNSRYEGSSEGSAFPSDSDDDADMEPVQPPPLDDGQEIDPAAFALELDQTLMTDEETPGGDNDTFKLGATTTTGPVSLNQYAGGGQGTQDDDDYSSSEEDSDD